jgi:Protein of unknown function (DUF2934)
MKAVHHDLIKLRAYEIWEERGRPLGRDKEHWAQAEQELLGAAQEIGAKATESETEPPRSAATQSSVIQEAASKATAVPSRRRKKEEAESQRPQRPQ